MASTKKAAAKSAAKKAPAKKPAAKRSRSRKGPSPLRLTTQAAEGLTIHETAREQPIRQGPATSPTATVLVDGNRVLVVSRPHALDPVEVTPEIADTVAKDEQHDRELAEAAKRK